MDKIALLRRQIRSIATDSKEIFFPATIVSVSGNTCTIDVDGLLLDDVRLKPTTMQNNSLVGNDENGYVQMESVMLIIPAIGSDVLVGSLSGDYNNLVILSVNEADKIEYTSNGQNLMQLITTLIQTLVNATVITPLGNGTFDPAVITQLNNIEMSFKQLFK